MRAVFLTHFGNAESAFEIREVETPKPKEHQILIRVEAFGLNFADVLARKGLYPETPDRPCILGYEVIGTVESIGEKVPNELIGKRVLALTRFGGYAEYAVTDYRASTIVPDGISSSDALAMGTQGVTAISCFAHCGELEKGDRILVHAGAGGVGNMICQLALSKGCEVFATAGSPEKLEFLKGLGVQHTINYRSEDYAEAIRKILDGEYLDVTFNSLAGKSVGKDMRLLGSGGKLVIFGAASRVGSGKGLISGLRLLLQTGFYSPLAMIMGSKSIIGINILKLGDNKPQKVAKWLYQSIKAVKAGEVKPIVHSAYSVEDLSKAHNDLESRKTIGKLVVTW